MPSSQLWPTGSPLNAGNLFFAFRLKKEISPDLRNAPMLIIVISTPPVHYDDYDDNYEMVDVISSFSERVLYYVVLKRSEGTPKRSAGRLRLKVHRSVRNINNADSRPTGSGHTTTITIIQIVDTNNSDCWYQQLLLI